MKELRCPGCDSRIFKVTIKKSREDQWDVNIYCLNCSKHFFGVFIGDSNLPGILRDQAEEKESKGDISSEVPRSVDWED